MLVAFWIITQNNKKAILEITEKLGNPIFGMYNNHKSMYISSYIHLEKEANRGHLKSKSKMSIGSPIFSEFLNCNIYITNHDIEF